MIIAFSLLAILIFAIDLVLPLGVAGGVSYVLVVLATLWSDRKSDVILAAITCTILTWLGLLLSPPGGIMWMGLFNRFLAMIVIWTTAILVYHRKRVVDRLKISEARLSMAIEISGVGIYDHTIPIELSGYHSEQLANILGYTS